MFLFENYLDASLVLKQDKNTDIAFELEKIGFHSYEIDRALHWLEGLMQIQTTMITQSPLSTTSMRHYNLAESSHIGLNGMGFLLYLEQINILDPMTREIVIDRVMALDSREVDIPRIRWVVLMALFNQPEKKSALRLLQEMILADAFDVLH